jgi:hypothetical protein
MGRIMLEAEVLKGVLDRLALWEIRKVVKYHQRMNSGSIMVGRRPIRMAKPGTPDVLCIFSHENRGYVYWIECKRTGEKLREGPQADFPYKFKGIDNVIFEMVTDPRQVDITIEKITNYTDGILESICVF